MLLLLQQTGNDRQKLVTIAPNYSFYSYIKDVGMACQKVCKQGRDDA